MNKKIKRILSITLSIILVMCLALNSFAIQYNTKEVTAADFESDGIYGYITADEIDPDNLSNSVVIPGLFQSRIRLYNEDGTVMLNSDGEEYSSPFFLETTSDIVKLALKKVLAPLLLTLVTRFDIGGRLSDNFAEALSEILGEKIRSDSNGNLVYNVKADKYNAPLSQLTEEEKEYIYDQVPLMDYADIVDEEHIYFFSYCSFGNLNDTVDELYDFIKMAAAASPTGKANIIPISQGGSLAVNLFERHKDVGQYLDRVVYIVPALDGTVLMGEIFTEGIIDDNESLYNEIFPVLLYDDDQPWMGWLVNVLLHIIPNKALNAILDKSFDSFIECLKNSTCIWGLVDSGNYKEAADKYLSGEENAVIRKQTDEHYQAQLNRYDNIKYEMETYGVQVFDIVDYNYRMYPLIDSWKSVNADGIINIESESMGATSYGIDVQLPSDYVPAKGSKYVDKYNIVDAGTGLLPDNTFYFHNQNHEATARNDVLMKLAICLITDNNFTSIDSYPDRYPQFLESGEGKGMANELRGMNSMLGEEDIGDVDRAALEALTKKGAAFLNNANRTAEETEAFRVQFEKERAEVLWHETIIDEEPTFKDKFEESFNSGFTSLLKGLSGLMVKTMIF